MSGLVLQKIQKRFGQVVALKQTDLTVHTGEFVSLLGPSGCGKTTALRIIAGFERPDSGRVLVEGKDVTNVSANKRDMGMVFQAYSLFPNMTARQNVEFGMKIRGRSAKERAQRAVELLDLVGLALAMDRYPHQLSGGQQQRVALARALAIEPRVLLLDEPLSALDAKVRVQLREEIRRIQTRLGITALYVTHDQEEALSISDRVVVLSQGQIEQVGPPAEIYGTPNTLFVAEFVGTTNRIPGTVSADGAGIVEAQGLRLPADAARALSPGTSVMVLVRPESIELNVLPPGDPVDGRLRGMVMTQTFLGSVTRLVIATPVGEMKVDIPTVTAPSYVGGTQVGLLWKSDAPHLIRLEDGAGNGSSAGTPSQLSADLTEVQSM